VSLPPNSALERAQDFQSSDIDNSLRLASSNSWEILLIALRIPASTCKDNAES